MAYIGNLSSTDQLQVENIGVQTAIALTTSSAGQQQSQGTSLTTGNWVVPPTLFRTATGWILRIEAAQEQFFVQLAAGQMNLLSAPPTLLGAEILPLQPVTVTSASTAAASSMPPMSSLPPMSPLSPMPPMQMGDMQMQLEPMQMRMGNMQMQIGTPPSIPAPETTQRFCSQCGKAVSFSDRFCAQCGHQLTSQ
uniref:zinc ribbon domain-containing protein n=1 Tax=Trichocoleus desertorum TaxID=1481672 RepID=UPI0025B2892D|nr:zinc ribbon domain-containing protein [Trichocoleus desertorum]